MRNFIVRYYKSIICVLVTAVCFTCVGALGEKALSRNPQSAQENAAKPASADMDALEKAKEVLSYVDSYYIGSVDDTTMADALAEGVIKGTGDRWSYYISKEEYEDYLEGVNNAYVGVGIVIQLVKEDDPGFTVIQVSKGGPAEQAGIKAGDMLVAVEGESAIKLGIDETKNRVRGEEGKPVTLRFLRDGKEQDYTITRAQVAIVNVEYKLFPKQIGYISIGNFDANCARDSIAAIKDLQEQGAKCLIFDVRNNPGGMKDELVALLDFLLPEGKLFISEDYTGKEAIDYSDERHLDMPLTVLVNQNSYSAAEFFAAALQEYGAASVVGVKTSGKGYFQTTFRLSDGSAIALSIGKYRTPKGVSLAEIGGLTPDIPVEVDEQTMYKIYYGQLEAAEDPQLQAAMKEVLKR